MEDFLFSPPIRLNLAVDSEQLYANLVRLPTAAWQTTGAAELGAQMLVPLVSVGGTLNNDFALAGAMRATPWLAECPAIAAFLGRLHIPLSRCRLLRLDAHTESKALTQCYYHWWRRAAWYIPLNCLKGVCLESGSQVVFFDEGTSWRINMLMPLRLCNPTDREAFLLVVESKAMEPGNAKIGTAGLWLETYCFEVLTAAEFVQLTQGIITEIREHPRYPVMANILVALQQRWAQVFARFGHTSPGELYYRDILLNLTEQVILPLQRGGGWWSDTMRCVLSILKSLLASAPRVDKPRLSTGFLAQQRRKRALPTTVPTVPVFDRPLFLVSAPRAGSTLLFERLAGYPDLWTIAEESHEAIENIATLHPAAQAYHSNRLTAAEAKPEVLTALRVNFTRQLQNRAGELYLHLPPEKRPHRVRFLEKTPKNALRVPFLRAVFPDARFIYLYREPRENISSLIEGWRSRRFIAYQNLPDWPHRDWSFLLTPDWRDYQNASLAEIATYQWVCANQTLLEDLQEVPFDQQCRVNYAELIANPQLVIQRIGKLAELRTDIDWEEQLQHPLPVSRMTLSTPAPDKWKRHEAEILALYPNWAPLWEKLTAS